MAGSCVCTSVPSPSCTDLSFLRRFWRFLWHLLCRCPPPGSGGRCGTPDRSVRPLLPDRVSATRATVAGAGPSPRFWPREENPEGFAVRRGVRCGFVDAAHRGLALLSFCHESVSDGVSAPAWPPRWPGASSSAVYGWTLSVAPALRSWKERGRLVYILLSPLCLCFGRVLAPVSRERLLCSFFLLFLVLSLSGFDVGVAQAA